MTSHDTSSLEGFETRLQTGRRCKRALTAKFFLPLEQTTSGVSERRSPEGLERSEGVSERSGETSRRLMRSDSQRKRKKNSCEGKPDLLFSFSRFCFPIRNNGRKTNAAGISASPHMRGAFGGVDGGVACECASRVAARHGADAQGGWINGSRADDNQRIMTSNSFLPIKPVIMQLSADPSDFPPAANQLPFLLRRTISYSFM